MSRSRTAISYFGVFNLITRRVTLSKWAWSINKRIQFKRVIKFLSSKALANIEADIRIIKKNISSILNVVEAFKVRGVKWSTFCIIENCAFFFALVISVSSTASLRYWWTAESNVAFTSSMTEIIFDFFSLVFFSSLNIVKSIIKLFLETKIKAENFSYYKTSSYERWVIHLVAFVWKKGRFQEEIIMKGQKS